MSLAVSRPVRSERASAGFRTTLVGRVLVVRLEAPPSMPVLADLSAEVARARDTAGVPLIYVAVVPHDAQAVAPDIRPLMREFGHYVSSVSASVLLVVEATGFAGTVLRSAITAVMMLTRERNVTVVGTFGEALSRLTPTSTDAQIRAVAEAAKKIGITS